MQGRRQGIVLNALLQPRPLGNRFIDFFGTENGDAIHAILKKTGPRLRGVFSGHIHQAD